MSGNCIPQLDSVDLTIGTAINNGVAIGQPMNDVSIGPLGPLKRVIARTAVQGVVTSVAAQQVFSRPRDNGFKVGRAFGVPAGERDHASIQINAQIIGRIGQVQSILAFTTVENIRAQITDQKVIAQTTRLLVVTAITGQGVVTISPKNGICATAATDVISSVRAGDQVVAIRRNMGFKALDRMNVAIGPDGLTRGEVQFHFGAGISEIKRVIASTTVVGIRGPETANHEVVAVTAMQGVVTTAAIKRVVTSPPLKQFVAVKPCDKVVTIPSRQGSR